MDSPDQRLTSHASLVMLAERLRQEKQREPAFRVSILLMVALALHAVMYFHDAAHPESFLTADRAISRLATIQGLYTAWEQGSTAAWLVSHGIVGDYLLQALLIALAGPAGLILFQVALTLLAGYAVFRLAGLLGLSFRLALLATVLWLLLPHTLLFPHQLAAEALYTPLLTISLWLTAEFVARPKSGRLIAAALLLGIACLMRPVTLLWPLLVVVLIAGNGRKRAAASYAAIALLPVLLWMSFIGLQTGSFGLGKSEHDLGHNLYQRVVRIGETLPADEALAVREAFLTQGQKGTLGVVDYARFASRYPGPFLEHAARDTAIFIGKSGIERLPIDYLAVNAENRAILQDTNAGWRARLEQEGMLSALYFLWQSQGWVLAVSLFGSLLLLGLMVAAAAGSWHLLDKRASLAPVQRFVAALLLCLPPYILIFSQVVDAVQSRHRAPAEAAIVLLAVFGWRQVALRFTHPPSPREV